MYHEQRFEQVETLLAEIELKHAVGRQDQRKEWQCVRVQARLPLLTAEEVDVVNHIEIIFLEEYRPF
jgi:hypothetical protein